MATTFKTFLNNDIAATRTMLHEAIPITGSLVSGTYGGVTVALGSEPHIKNYSHGMFQSVYDYPYLSSSANHIFDITIGVSSKGGLYSATTSQQAKKSNIYNQMAQVLMGHDVTGAIQQFDEDGNILAGGTKLNEVFFLNFARLLAKDEVKKGSFQLELGTTNAHSQGLNAEFTERIKLTDASGSDGFFVNSPAGEYGILYAQTTADGDGTLSTPVLANETVGTSATHPAAGLLFYQAGIAVVSGSVFNGTAVGGLLKDSAQAVDCIDTTGYVASNADASFTISIPTAAGGLGGTAVTILLDENQNGGHTTNGANKIAIGTFDGSETDALAAGYIIDAINGVTDARIVYASSGNGEAADDLGVTAAQGSSDTQITLTVDDSGTAGNFTGALASTAGTDIIDVTAFTGGGDNPALRADTGFTGFNMTSGSTIEATANAIRNRIYSLSFNNSTELNSSIYFCRINHNDFNYSSNPTYLSGSKIRVKNSTVDNPVTYFTTVGLYSADNELLAVAKLSEPLKKDPSTEMTLRVRLDY
jgi:hypothetical protein